MILDGLLEVAFLDGFVPDPVDTFPFINLGGTLTGQFAQVNILGLGAGATAEVMFEAASGQMVLSNVIPVPEPSSLVLSALGLLSLLATSRRRRA